MKRFASITRQNVTRSIFILSVLIGLFFSGGEGIQLLPFPITEVHNSKNTFFILEKNPKSYAFSVYNSGAQFALLKFKFQKHAHHSCPVGHLILDSLKADGNFRLRAALNHDPANFPRRFVVLSSQSDRAPPAV